MRLEGESRKFCPVSDSDKFWFQIEMNDRNFFSLLFVPFSSGHDIFSGEYAKSWTSTVAILRLGRVRYLLNWSSRILYGDYYLKKLPRQLFLFLASNFNDVILKLFLVPCLQVGKPSPVFKSRFRCPGSYENYNCRKFPSFDNYWFRSFACGWFTEFLMLPVYPTWNWNNSIRRTGNMDWLEPGSCSPHSLLQ